MGSYKCINQELESENCRRYSLLAFANRPYDFHLRAPRAVLHFMMLKYTAVFNTSKQQPGLHKAHILRSTLPRNGFVEG